VNPPATTACQEKRQRDDCRRRQEKAIIKSPAGAEERVGHHAGEDENERDHQPNTDPVPANVAGHESKIAAGSSDRSGERSCSMEKRLVTRYAMRSAEAADENQRRVEGVFAELNATRPDTVSYIVLRLADDSFVHASFHNHGDDEVNPIASTAAFAHFQEDHANRREGGIDQQTAELVGAYVTTID
jgi:hypothetical protein